MTDSPPSGFTKVPKSVYSARWIWTADDPDETNVWIYARRTFEMGTDAITDAWLNITADLRYVAWLNEQMIGFGPPKSTLTRPTLDRYPLSQYLRPGRNVLVVLVYSLGHVANISSVMSRRGALLASIEVGDYIIVTDRQWKAKRERAYLPCAVRRGEMQPHNEVFDTRCSLGEPWRADYDDSLWPIAIELSNGPLLDPWEAIEPRDIPLIPWQWRIPDRMSEAGIASFSDELVADRVDNTAQQIKEADRLPDRNTMVMLDMQDGRITANVSSLPVRQGVYVRWDMGRIWTGYPVFDIEGESGTVIDFSYAEHLCEGKVDPTKHGLHYFDRIILGGERRCHRVMWPKCLRYLQADVRGGRAVIRQIGMETSTYPVQRCATFSSSDPVLDQAWEISAHTLQLCMEDNFMDTPWRERGSWLGDTLVMVPAAAAIFGDTALARRFLRLHMFGQQPNGAMAGKYPANAPSMVWTWSLTFPMILANYLQASGDELFVRAAWPTCRRMIDWLESHRTSEGLYGNFPLRVTHTDNIYTFIDWAPIDTAGCNAAFNAYACACLHASSKLARMANDERSAAFCDQRATELRQLFQMLFWDARRGIFVNGRKDGALSPRWGCQENYLAIVFGLATDSQRRQILEQLQKEDLFSFFIPNASEYDEEFWSMAIALNTYRWDNRKMVPLGTPFFANWALTALFELGMGKEAMELIRRRWGDFSREGGTTVREAWDMQGSLSHGWSCAPLLMMQKYILGIHAADQHIEILPSRFDLRYAAGRVCSRHGLVHVAWQWNAGWQLEVDLPSGCNAWIGLPADEINELVIDGKLIEHPQPRERNSRRYLVACVEPGHHRILGPNNRKHGN